MSNQQILLKAENVSKTFPGVKALKNVKITVKSGEVHALVGENGAGKSTLIKVLTGAHQMDPGGKIYIHGEETTIRNPGHAKELGIGVVYQEVMMAQHLSVGENFFLGELPYHYGVIDWQKIRSVTQNALANVDVNVDPKQILRDLPVATQEMVSIAKTVYEKAKIIIFDEPTALLANEEVDILKKIIQRLKTDGCGIIYISHRMEEIFEMCDTVTVLKDGEYVDTQPVQDLTEESLIQMMVGRKLEDMYNIQHFTKGEEVVRVDNLTRKGAFENISFKLHKGEILGFYGLVGAGRTEVMRCLAGADLPDSGEIYINRQKVAMRSPLAARRHGIAFLTEDRKTQGLGMNLDIKFNINMASFDLVGKYGFVNPSSEERVAQIYFDKISIKAPSLRQRIRNLSGGNQQKVVIAKWLARHSDIFIFDEPTVGVDVGAKVEIYALIEEFIKEGKAVILISSYLPEVMGLSDRIHVLYEGRQQGLVERDEFYRNGEMDEAMMVGLASGIRLGGVAG